MTSISKSTWIIAISSIFISLFIAEVVIRFLFPQPVDYFYFDKNPKPNSSFTRWGIPVNLNSEGFRDINHQIEKKQNVYRIAVVGDSITYGSGVSFEDTYHQKLKNILKDKYPSKEIEILAFNQGATNTEWAFKTYNSNIKKYQPDLVILGFCLNDFERYDKVESERTKESIAHKILDFLADIHQTARLYSHLYFLVFERSRRLIYQHIIDRKIRTMDSWIPMLPDLPEYKNNFALQLESTAQLLKKFKEQIESDDGKFLAVIFPFEMQIGQREAEIYSAEYKIPEILSATEGRTQKLFTKALDNYGVSYVDLLDGFKDYKMKFSDKPLYFRELGGMLDWAHPNSDGHSLAADIIAKEIEII